MDCVTVIVKRVYRSEPLGGIVKRVLRGDYYRKELNEYLRENVLQVWDVFFKLAFGFCKNLIDTQYNILYNLS